MKTVSIRIGGLLRCCTLSIREDADTRETKPKEGERLTCKYCDNTEIIFHNGAWEWAREKAH
jgi:hypothetical protein